MVIGDVDTYNSFYCAPRDTLLIRMGSYICRVIVSLGLVLGYRIFVKLCGNDR
jgi:hypothetical protein